MILELWVSMYCRMKNSAAGYGSWVLTWLGDLGLFFNVTVASCCSLDVFLQVYHLTIGVVVNSSMFTLE